jgi:hypothetical protein
MARCAEDGALYVWGEDMTEVVGTDTAHRIVSLPLRVAAIEPRRAASVACGSSHFAVVTSCVLCSEPCAPVLPL